MKLSQDDLRRSTRGLPDDSLRHLIQRTSPDVAAEVVDKVLESMKEDRARDPFALLQPMAPGDDGAQLQSIKGLNLELGLFLAQFTGAAVYTDIAFHWEHLHKHTSAGLELDAPATWAPLIDRVNDTAFILDGDPQAVVNLRRSEASESIRRAFRKVATLSAKEPGKPSRKVAKEIAAELHQGIKTLRKKFRVADSPEAAGFTARVEMSIPKGGFERNTIRRLLLTFGRAKNVPTVPIGLHVKLEIAD